MIMIEFMKRFYFLGTFNTSSLNNFSGYLHRYTCNLLNGFLWYMCSIVAIALIISLSYSPLTGLDKLENSPKHLMPLLATCHLPTTKV